MHTHTHTHTHIWHEYDIYIYINRIRILYIYTHTYIVFVSVMSCIYSSSFRNRDVRGMGRHSQHGQEIFLLSKAFRPALSRTQFPIRCVTGVKRPVYEPRHSSPSKANFKNACCLSLLNDVPSWRGSLSITETTLSLLLLPCPVLLILLTLKVLFTLCFFPDSTWVSINHLCSIFPSLSTAEAIYIDW